MSRRELRLEDLATGLPIAADILATQLDFTVASFAQRTGVPTEPAGALTRLGLDAVDAEDPPRLRKRLWS